ncbi:cadherin-like domain-containing protein [Actinoplanes sp. TBRC 11911]|uniref:esterase-like activity of phytase family protein n=1 Tax=Actinoplanes sp. TBRC 11911 TaxID=2729386 RepID=UPI00145EAA9B|nr:esterase-like activity of phytase family protein [Actinoplanes sp. TBRC 11911]NMO50885.1 cadherin-like domain-containing protein [Actinoplanes sp. TBRC 11911]
MNSRSSRRTRGIAFGFAGAGALALTLVTPGAASAHGGNALDARDDSYKTSGTASVDARHGVFGNDRGDPLTLIDHTDPGHGTLTLNPDGSFRYVPAKGFHGKDSFTYTVSDAVQLYTTHIAPLATIGGVTIGGGGFGSAVTQVPGRAGEYYGLTDRGPNVDGPNGTKVEPLPNFHPQIGKFRFASDGRAVLEKTITLKLPNGTPYTGHVNTSANTGETITDLNGKPIPADTTGYDSEGLVALPDGTFWVSDEYGPLITHFDRDGRQIGRFSPADGTLPAELANRIPNKGMEGLTITPDGQTLVGVMQSALQQPDLTPKGGNVSPIRIVTVNLRTHATHEYLYLLDDPKVNGTAVSEITALSSTQFLVDERDGNFPPTAFKKIFKIDLTGATDVGPKAPGYDAAKGGYLINGKTVEATVGDQTTAAAGATLAAAGVKPVRKAPFLDVTNLLTTLDPAAKFFSHDKVEGVAALSGGRYLVISNDSDFGIDGLTQSATTPFTLYTKVSPTTGLQDQGEFLKVDMSKLPAATSTATVTISVR